jgi:hypothetical protein
MSPRDHYGAQSDQGTRGLGLGRQVGAGRARSRVRARAHRGPKGNRARRIGLAYLQDDATAGCRVIYHLMVCCSWRLATVAAWSCNWAHCVRAVQLPP